jgi:hypothetical protein
MKNAEIELLQSIHLQFDEFPVFTHLLNYLINQLTK